MTVRHLSMPLADSLAAAQAALLASPELEEEWVLPPGEAELAGPLSLGSPSHELRLRGSPEGTVLRLSRGTLTLTGSRVRLEGVRLEASEVEAVLSLSGDEVGLSGVQVHAESSSSCTAIDAVCRRAQLAGVEVLGLESGGVAVGVALSCAERIDVSDARVSGVRGEEAVGLRLLLSGLDGEGLSAVDLSVGDVEGRSGSALGLVAASAGSLRVRGFTVSEVRGDLAMGLLALGGRGVEVAIGHVEEVVGSGAPKCGVRVLAGPSREEVVVRDVAVERVAAPGDHEEHHLAQTTSEWRDWASQALQSLAGATLGPLTLPEFPAISDVVGLHVGAFVDEFAPLLDEGSPGALRLEDSSLHVITGFALVLEGGLRTALVRRLEAWTSLHGGFLQAEQLLLAQVTWHRHGLGLRFGPGEVRALDSLFSALHSEPFLLDEDTELSTAEALFAQGASVPFRELGPLPYVTPGAPELPEGLRSGLLPPPEEVDLRSLPDAAFLREAVPIPGDDAPPFVGAWEPEVEQPCELKDPLPRPLPAAPSAPAPGPLVNYRARDARTLLAVMMERARISMPTWSERGPADFTTMLLETVAGQLDSLSYRQERSVSEGFLEEARLRRSVEDHARALDYPVDPGLSATAMLRFRLEPEALALLEEGGLEIPEATLVANTSTSESTVVFATEEPLAWLPSLDAMTLAEDCPVGATSMLLSGTAEGLERNRWLLLHRGSGERGHVVRVTTLERSAHVTRVGWDPRRPAPVLFRASADPESGEPAAMVLGNVVPAHHGLPVASLEDSSSEGLEGDFEATLRPWRQQLSVSVDGSVEREVRLPFHPISIQARGWPLPGEEGRRGSPMLRGSVEGDPWSLVEELSTRDSGEEVFVLRTSADGGQALRFGDGTHGSALPQRTVTLELSLRVGLGRAGNVGEGVLTRLLQVPAGGARSNALLERPLDELRLLLRVDNPLPAVGGREPEPLERIRYRAPLGVSQRLSAVTAEDCVHLLQQLPEVAGAAARFLSTGSRSILRVTALLRDEDTLEPAERLRRWALVRRRLEEIRLLGFDVEAVPPLWVPLDLDVVVDARPHAHADRLHDAVEAAISGQGGLLDPDRSGLGGDVQLADLYQAALSVQGVSAVRVKRFRRLALHAPDQLSEGVIPIGPEEVAIVRAPSRPESEGLLTVTVCGGLR